MSLLDSKILTICCWFGVLILNTLSQNGQYEDKCYHNNDSDSLTILTQNKLRTDCEEWKLVSLEQTKIWDIIHFIITNFDRVKCIIVMNYPSQLHCCSFSVVASEKFRAHLFFRENITKNWWAHSKIWFAHTIWNSRRFWIRQIQASILLNKNTLSRFPQRSRLETILS